MKKKYTKVRQFWRTWRVPIVLGIALAMLMLCAGCTINTGGGSNYCLLYRPIYADYENDTAETIEQIDNNNVVYDILCT